jgi:hypothetical protein
MGKIPFAERISNLLTEWIVVPDTRMRLIKSPEGSAK